MAEEKADSELDDKAEAKAKAEADRLAELMELKNSISKSEWPKELRDPVI